MTDPERFHKNDCSLCPMLEPRSSHTGQVYKLLSLEFSIPIAERLSRNHDFIRVEPGALREWLANVKINQRHIDHIPHDIQNGIMITLPNGLGQPLIDGNHRAARSLRDGADFFVAVLNEKETHKLLRLTMGRSVANRLWTLLSRG